MTETTILFPRKETDMAPRIFEASIRYPDHEVTFRYDQRVYPVSEVVWALQAMANELSPNGSIRDHGRELRNMNNDGSWGIRRITLDMIHEDTKTQLLAVLDQYFEDAEEHEDHEVLTHMTTEQRIRDFALYLAEHEHILKGD